LIGKPDAKGAAGEEIYVRVGRRYGAFLDQGERRASLPDHQPPDELTVDVALEMLDNAAAGDEPIGVCPDTHKPVFLKSGRFGPYVQRGMTDDDEKPQNSSLLKGMDPEDVDLATALKLLSLPRTLGDDPKNAEPVVAHNGRYGPYIKCGDETRSLPAGISPLDVTFEQALNLLAQPKQRRGARAKREPLKVFGDSPVTGKPVQLLERRYGPYVTDGAVNASLPRGMTTDEITFDAAVDMLRIKAEKGPAKPKKAKKKAAKKKATKKKAAKKKKKKKAAKKKAPKKSAKK